MRAFPYEMVEPPGRALLCAVNPARCKAANETAAARLIDPNVTVFYLHGSRPINAAIA